MTYEQLTHAVAYYRWLEQRQHPHAQWVAAVIDAALAAARKTYTPTLADEEDGEIWPQGLPPICLGDGGLDMGPLGEVGRAIDRDQDQGSAANEGHHGRDRSPG